MAWETVMGVAHCMAEREREVGREGEIERVLKMRERDRQKQRE